MKKRLRALLKRCKDKNIEINIENKTQIFSRFSVKWVNSNWKSNFEVLDTKSEPTVLVLELIFCYDANRIIVFCMQIKLLQIVIIT